MIFQERHVAGFLWWRKVYYTYWKFVEGTVIQVRALDLETLRTLEKK